MAESKPDEGMSVKEIYVYPLKSLRGISPQSHLATYQGFQHDRRFMFQRVATGANMAVARETEMCLFTTHIPASNSSSSGNTDKLDSIEVHYTLPHVFKDPSNPISPNDPILVPLSPATTDLETVQVNMHSSPTRAYNMGSQYNDWFSTRFGYEVRLLYIGENKRLVLGNMPPQVAGMQRDHGSKGEGRENTYERITSTGNPNQGSSGGWLNSIGNAVSNVLSSTITGSGSQESQYEGVDAGLTFSDVAPYLITTTSSYNEILSRLPPSEDPSMPSILDPARFRPNILLHTPNLPPFDEDFWAELLITSPTTGKKVSFVLTQNCARCNSLNVDYTTGKVGEGERGKVLAKLAKDRRVDLGAKYSGVFGRYGFLKRYDNEEDGDGLRISVDDVVEVVRRNGERTRFEWPNLSTDS